MARRSAQKLSDSIAFAEAVLSAAKNSKSAVRRWLVVVVVSCSVWLTERAAAQCTSNASSCVACHETQGSHPVLQRSASPWHADHGFGDLCVACVATQAE